MVKRTPQRRCHLRQVHDGITTVISRPRSAARFALAPRPREGPARTQPHHKLRKLAQKLSTLRARNAQLQWEISALQRTELGSLQRFHSPRHYESTGIGLAIVQKAVKRRGGRVGVDSTPGQGSRFWLELQPA